MVRSALGATAMSTVLLRRLNCIQIDSRYLGRDLDVRDDGVNSRQGWLDMGRGHVAHRGGRRATSLAT